MKKLLCILSGMNAGGAETFLMKIYRQLAKTKYQMDFCINAPGKCFYEDEILSLCGKIYRISSKSASLKDFKKQLYNVVRLNDYKYVLRISSNAAGFLDLKIAHKAGAEICAVRSSNSSDGGGFKSKIAHRLGRILYGKYVNVKIAPSDLAAEYTFGKKAYESGDVNILHNAIDIDQYGFKADMRCHIRSEFGLSDDTTIIGHVGRFMTQKNHDFLLEVFSEYLKINGKSILMLVGGGELESAIKQKASELGISDKIIFTGVRSDIPALLSAMDVFAFPSLYEGMPNTVIEAQATGLPCLIADTITREADITGLVHYLPLGDAGAWAHLIAELPQAKRETPIQKFKENGYDIETVAKQFVKLIFRE
mgnify:CR=1 FL=1